MTWLDDWENISVAMTAERDRALAAHLLREDGQEDLCFVTWRPSSGATRGTAVIRDIVLPGEGDRLVHGNVSFVGDYFMRAASEAAAADCGLALLHSHPGAGGWQRLSEDDFLAEAGYAAQAVSITGLPLLGLTLAGDDRTWSGRMWRRVTRRSYEPVWCNTVRIVGEQLRVSFNPVLMPTPRFMEGLERTVSAWGPKVQADLARLRIGVIGAGSVGAIVAEGLARMGIESVSVMDFDLIEEVNRDRLLHADGGTIGAAKAEVLASALKRSSTAQSPRMRSVVASVCEQSGYLEALDQDVLFSCVDRPWARAVLNLIAYAHLIPVVDGGVLVDSGTARMRGAEWRAHIAAPGRRCLECLGQYDPGLVQLERDGLLDDSTYLAQLPGSHVVKRNENVFAFAAAAASVQLIQLLSMVVAPAGMSDLRAQIFHFATGRIDVDERDCDPGCPYSGELTAAGDLVPTVTGQHSAAEHLRERRSI